MRAAPPPELDRSTLIAVLAEGWGVEVETVDYAALGGGSYHWVAAGRDGSRIFVTADDLDQKPWLGATRDSACEGLSGAFATAVALRNAGLHFVLAPIPTAGGATLRRVDPRHTVAVLPFVEGQPGEFGQYEPAERRAVVTMIAELHQGTPAVATVARRIDLALPGRPRLESALQDVHQPWSGGPHSEPARQLLAGHASDFVELLALFDRLASEVASHSADWVVTHGEPHGGNVIRTGESRVLIDWDTVALAPPERDLWMLMREADEEAAVLYAAATGREPDATALDFFRLTWDLADTAAFTHLLRSPHSDTADTAHAYEALTYYMTSRDRWAELFDAPAGVKAGTVTRPPRHFTSIAQVRELRPGLWHWQAPHPQWRPTEPWSENVSSYAIDDGERLLLFDPLAVPSELGDLAADRETAIVLTAPWHERDAESLVERLGVPVYTPLPDTAQDLMDMYGVTAEQAGDGSPDVVWLLREQRGEARPYSAGDRLPFGADVFPGHKKNDTVLWVGSQRAVISGDTLVDFGRGLEINERWLRPGVTREEIAEGLRPLLALPVEHVLATHGGPTDRTALERALSPS